MFVRQNHKKLNIHRGADVFSNLLPVNCSVYTVLLLPTYPAAIWEKWSNWIFQAGSHSHTQLHLYFAVDTGRRWPLSHKGTPSSSLGRRWFTREPERWRMHYSALDLPLLCWSCELTVLAESKKMVRDKSVSTSFFFWFYVWVKCKIPRINGFFPWGQYSLFHSLI